MKSSMKRIIAKFKSVPVGLGLFLAILFVAVPVDYTAEIAEAQAQIEALEAQLGEKTQTKIQLGEQYTPQYEAIERESQEIAQQITTLTSEKTALAAKIKMKNETLAAEKANNPYANNTLIAIDACNTSGNRTALAKVDIGYGEREYYAYTNEHAQLVRVDAKTIQLQATTEDLTTKGRYCHDEAKVSGTESSTLDEGHVIADSLGGTSNAYNITPQNSTLNRSGAQADMEETLRTTLKGNGTVTDFVATITYPDTTTQIPSHYKYEMVINGTAKTFEFENVVVDETPVVEQPPVVEAQPEAPTTPQVQKEYFQNCTELKAVYPSGVDASHPAYQKKMDRDGDGYACES